MKIEVLDSGSLAYAEGLNLQNKIHSQVLNGDKQHTLILCEHKHVYTFGKSADKNNLLINKEFLKAIDAEVYETDRGGDITYHGPGQLVGYPIIHLSKHNIGVRQYVELLESALIDSLANFGIKAYQIPKLVGIWVGEKDEVKRKIGAIGIRIKNGVSMHGFALNVNTDLSYFNHIVPCGISDKSVTSIYEELGKDLWTEFKQEFSLQFAKKLSLF